MQLILKNIIYLRKAKNMQHGIQLKIYSVVEQLTSQNKNLNMLRK